MNELHYFLGVPPHRVAACRRAVRYFLRSAHSATRRAALRAWLPSLTLLLYSSLLFAQQPFEIEKRDYVWLTGDESWGGGNFGGTIIDFNTDPPTFTYEYRYTDYQRNAAFMCDKEGNLILATNGNRVVNAFDSLLVEGDSINAGFDWYPENLPQSSIFLPLPDDNENRYFILLHKPSKIQSVDFDFEGETYHSNWTSPEYRYSIIDLQANDGQGAVVEKAMPFITNRTELYRVNACRHGNGRDWWVVAFRENSNKYFKILVDPSGVNVLGQVNIDTFIPMRDGFSVFTPDGTKMVRCLSLAAEKKHLEVFDFNRCTGLLSNMRRFELLDTTINSIIASIAISPNSRYVYYGLNKKVYQFDLTADDIAATQTIVAEYDGFVEILPTHFGWSQLAPDSKVYFCTSNGTKYMHTIEHPNRAGLASQVVQRSVTLPTYNALTIGWAPNYTLGPKDNSPCDTLGIDNFPIAKFKHDFIDSSTVWFEDHSQLAPDTYLWDFGDNSAGSTETDPQHSYASGGIYEVCLTVANENGSDTYCDTVHINTATATDDPEMSAAKVYPTLFSDYLCIQTDANSWQGGAATFVLYDALGREVVRQNIGKPFINKFMLGQLPAGVYVYTIEQAGSVLQSGKVVKY